MKILVTGANGQVGWELVRRGHYQGHEIIGCGRDDLDIGNEQSVLTVLTKIDPGLIINCAAYTAVDRAETEKEKAYGVNRDGPARLARNCAARQIPLVHLSSDYVFDGALTRPYRETDPVNPLGIYGKSKEAGEQEVRQGLAEHLIIRTSWVFGVHGHNFVKTMVRLGCEREELRVVDDQWGCPTSAADLAEGLLRICGIIAEKRPIPWGTYHYCGATRITWHGFAKLIFAIAGDRFPLRIKKITSVPSSEFPTPARRPMNSVLDCARIKEAFGVEGVELRESLSRFFPGVNQEK